MHDSYNLNFVLLRGLEVISTDDLRIDTMQLMQCSARWNVFLTDQRWRSGATRQVDG